MITAGRLKQWLGTLKDEDKLELVMDCFSGTSYLKVPRPLGWQRIDLEDGTIQGCVSGRISCSTGSIQELDRK